MRCGVTYGVPDDERKKEKRVAVPYEAADVPSKKNEYSQPDVSILLSFLAYYNEGLNEEEFEEMLMGLKNGEFPKGYRLYSGVNEDEGRVMQFRKIIVDQFFDPKNREAEYQFIEALS